MIHSLREMFTFSGYDFWTSSVFISAKQNLNLPTEYVASVELVLKFNVTIG